MMEGINFKRGEPAKEGVTQQTARFSSYSRRGNQAIMNVGGGV